MTKVRIGHNSGQGFVEDESLSLSEQGYEFQFRLTKLILERLQGFSTVTLRDMEGNTLTADNLRKGPDGGLDLIIHVEAKTERAARSVYTKVRNLVLAIELE